MNFPSAGTNSLLQMVQLYHRQPSLSGIGTRARVWLVHHMLDVLAGGVLTPLSWMQKTGGWGAHPKRVNVRSGNTLKSGEDLGTVNVEISHFNVQASPQFPLTMLLEVGLHNGPQIHVTKTHVAPRVASHQAALICQIPLLAGFQMLDLEQLRLLVLDPGAELQELTYMPRAMLILT